MAKKDDAVPDESVTVREYRDGRVLMTNGEVWAALRVIRKLLTEDQIEWVPLGPPQDGRPRTIKDDQLKAAVVHALRAINEERGGHPEGTVAVDTKGRTARRYYSDSLGRNVWLITEPPTDGNVEVDNIDRLGEGDGWAIVHKPAWMTSL